MSIDHMEFWAQLEARIQARRAELQHAIDNSDNVPEPIMRAMVGERRGLQATRQMAREVYAEMTGTAQAGPDPVPQDDFPV